MKNLYNHIFLSFVNRFLETRFRFGSPIANRRGPGGSGGGARGRSSGNRRVEKFGIGLPNRNRVPKKTITKKITNNILKIFTDLLLIFIDLSIPVHL